MSSWGPILRTYFLIHSKRGKGIIVQNRSKFPFRRQSWDNIAQKYSVEKIEYFFPIHGSISDTLAFKSNTFFTELRHLLLESIRAENCQQCILGWFFIKIGFDLLIAQKSFFGPYRKFWSKKVPKSSHFYYPFLNGEKMVQWLCADPLDSRSAGTCSQCLLGTNIL